MKADQFNSVWDAIEDTPEHAENMRLRADLMHTLGQHIQDNGWSQTDAAKPTWRNSASNLGFGARKDQSFLSGKPDPHGGLGWSACVDQD